MANDKNFVVKNGLTTGTTPVINSSGFWIGSIIGRTPFSVSTGSLAPNASVNIELPSFRSYALLSATINAACWLRLYTDADSRTADLNRTINVDPLAGSGVVAEIITAGNETVKMTPFVIGGNLSTVTSNNIFMRATNLSGSTININIELNLIRLEQ